MAPHQPDRIAPPDDHGGSLARAEALFPGGPRPWLDLSTGINPHPYPLLELPATALTRLPEPAHLRELAAIASRAYGAASPAHVVPAAGTQALLPLAMRLVRPGIARILSPTYSEHSRAAAHAGHTVEEVVAFDELFGADLAILVNPNNPDGRMIAHADILELAAHLGRRGGLVLVDEAFMDVGPTGESLAADVAKSAIVVLRSFGKFFGLAGVRLGFAIAAPGVAERLSAELGPWPVSGTALAYGLRALADRAWQTEMRAKLATEAMRLDGLLGSVGLAVAGGTNLFRLVRNPKAPALFTTLGRRGILVRNFRGTPDALRFGLPGGPASFDRLAEALHAWHEADSR
ncbi:MAG: threonine-phosphate decarboxylase CobD [Bauldia sp.]